MSGKPFPGAAAPFKSGGGRAAAPKAGASGKFPVAKRKEMARSGAAMPDGSFPIANTTDLRNAVHAVGRAKDPAAAKSHILKRARALQAVHLVPSDWLKK